MGLAHGPTVGMMRGRGTNGGLYPPNWVSCKWGGFFSNLWDTFCIFCFFVSNWISSCVETKGRLQLLHSALLQNNPLSFLSFWFDLFPGFQAEYWKVYSWLQFDQQCGKNAKDFSNVTRVIRQSHTLREAASGMCQTFLGHLIYWQLRIIRESIYLYASGHLYVKNGSQLILQAWLHSC